jgi:threonine dehydratase
MSSRRPGMSFGIDREGIEETARIISPFLRETPVVRTNGADFGLAGFPLTLKLELLQHSGSFKARGAFAGLKLRPVPEAGVVAASGGNHGVAVAYAAMRLSVPARIYLPAVASPAKQARIREYGAELVIAGERYQDALVESEAWVSRSGALPVHAFDQRETLLGQGTLGRELSHQAPDLDTLFVAVGGGGLIGGIAGWFERSLRIVGVEPESAPTLTKALEAGRPVDAPAGGIAADSLAPRRVGELMFPLARDFVDRVLLVSDEEIRRAQELLWRTLRVVAEPGAAAPLAALSSGAYTPLATERVGAIVSGGNTTAVDFAGASTTDGTRDARDRST